MPIILCKLLPTILNYACEIDICLLFSLNYACEIDIINSVATRLNIIL